MLTRPIDFSKFVLGELCANGHDHEATGKSLRYLKKEAERRMGKCRECDIERKLSKRTAWENLATPSTEGAHPVLKPLLVKHGVSFLLFTKRGTLPEGVSEKRSAVITDLHNAGFTWKEMMTITGLTNGTIQRNSKVLGGSPGKENQRQSAIKNGMARKGEVKPWLSVQMKKAWEDGKFDFHIGRVRSPEEKLRLKEGWTELKLLKVSLNGNLCGKTLILESLC